MSTPGDETKTEIFNAKAAAASSSLFRRSEMQKPELTVKAVEIPLDTAESVARRAAQIDDARIATLNNEMNELGLQAGSARHEQLTKLVINAQTINAQSFDVAAVLGYLKQLHTLSAKEIADLQASVGAQISTAQQNNSLSTKMNASVTQSENTNSATVKSSMAGTAFFNTMNAQNQQNIQTAQNNNTPIVGLLLAWLLENDPKYFTGAAVNSRSENSDNSDQAEQTLRMTLLGEEEAAKRKLKAKLTTTSSTLFNTNRLFTINVFELFHNYLDFIEQQITKPILNPTARLAQKGKQQDAG